MKKLKKLMLCLFAAIMTLSLAVATGATFIKANAADDTMFTKSVPNNQITVLDFDTASRWNFYPGNGTGVADGKMTVSSNGADGESPCRWEEALKKPAVGFTFKSAENITTDERSNTMWTIRAQLHKGGSFSVFTGYHVVLYPNQGTAGKVILITNPKINIHGEKEVDLKGLLFDGKEHKVVLGAIDQDDGKVCVFLDIDGNNVWKVAVDTVISRENTSFVVGHRDETPGFCEQLDYELSTLKNLPEDMEVEPVKQKEPTITDKSDIFRLSTANADDWGGNRNGTDIVNGQLVASSAGADGETPAYYKNAITENGVKFRFKSAETYPDNEKSNTMWTVRAELGKGGSFAAFTGYHIVLYPNQGTAGKVILITNPNINIHGEKEVDLKGLLFDGKEHEVVVGAIDRDDGKVYVFLDIDGNNEWNVTVDTVIEKENTSFCVGHRDESMGFSEQLDYVINYQEFILPEHSVFSLQENDFAKNNWDIYQNISISDKTLISTSGATHAMAKYSGGRYGQEDAIRFKIKIANVKDKIMLGLRADVGGGEMFWNCSMICVRFSLTDYDVQVNSSGVWNDFRTVASNPLKTQLERNVDYVIEAGAIDVENGTLIYLAIDDVVQFAYTDDLEHRIDATNRTFKIGSYDESVFVVSDENSSGQGTSAERENADLAATKVGNENWANILNAFNPDLTKGENDSLSFGNMGAIVYAERLSVSQIDFDFKFTDVKGQVAFLFNKARRGTFFNQFLQQAEYQTNMCYAVVIQADGIVSVVKATASALDSATALKSLWVSPFGNDQHHITIRFSTEGNAATIEIYFDGALKGYSTEDPTSSETFRSGFVGFQKLAYGGTVEINDFRYTGEVIDSDEGKNTEVKNVFLAQFYAKDKHDFLEYEGSNVLRWSYPKDSDYLKEIEVKVEGNTVGKVGYPVSTVIIPDELVGKEAEIIVHSVDGITKNKTIELKDERAESETTAAERTERIAVRENAVTGFAEFYYDDGVTPAAEAKRFMPVGHNFLTLKDGWESSCFEASDVYSLNNYDPKEVEAMLAAMAKYNYNSLRVFLGSTTSDSVGGMAGPASTKKTDADFYMYNGKRAYYLPYMNNLVDFMTRCQKYGIYILYVLGDSLPGTDLFNVGGLISDNARYLNAQQIYGKQLYAKSFIQYFLDYDEEHGTSLINTIFALSNANESFYNSATWPFNQRGTANHIVTLANGKTYDMDVLKDRQDAADEGKLYFYSKFVEAVKSVDPRMLTCEGTYTLMAAGNYKDSDPDANYGLTQIGDWNSSFPTSLDVMMKTDLDFFDVHIYHTTGKDLIPAVAENMRSLKYGEAVRKGQATKPIIMAEFGAFRAKCNNDFEYGKKLVVDQRDYVLSDAYHFQGFITWQLNEFKQTELFAMFEDDEEFFKNELRYIYIQKSELIGNAKTTYVVGDELDFAGLKIKDLLSDGTTKTTDVTADMFWNEEDIDMNEIGKKTVELIYKDSVIFTYEITVEKKNEEPDSSSESESETESESGESGSGSGTSGETGSAESGSSASGSESGGSVSGGCFGALSGVSGAAVIVLIAACAAFCLKKREEK